MLLDLLRWPLPRYRPDPARAHHGPAGYRNLYPFKQPRFADLARWRWQRRRLRAAHRLQDIRCVVPDAAALAANRDRPSYTWIGHASGLIQLAGVNLLLDPVWSERASPLQWAGPKRLLPPALPLGALPHIDVVMVTHNHYDHLDFATLSRLAAQPGGAPLFVAPLGVGATLRRAGAPADRVVELDWWERHRHGEVDLTLTPAQHWSKRWAWGDRNRALWGGFAAAGGGVQLWYPGDTGYHPELFARIAEHLGKVDLALLPIGAYQPRWFLAAQHIDPAEAVEIFRIVQPRRALAVHWGSFVLTDEPLHQPPLDLAEALARSGVDPADFGVPAIGETFWLDA
ncbi:MBL fold metallo-hydrolase [Chromobacterium sp. CV08]|uniref:MBL fold metallo-hydrolase n=1 Tax=Chromobacterium sp. CV08 TaxID=3133274 RepID=UPI003DA96D4A